MRDLKLSPILCDPVFAPIRPEYLKGNLILANYEFGYKFAIKLAQLLITHPIIRHADFSCSNMCRKSLNIITYALQFNHSLHHLNLGHNEIDDDGMRFVAELLKKKSMMTALILNNNLIGNKGLSLLIDALRTCRVYFVDLSFNVIGNSGMISLAEFAKTCSSLVEMNLRWSDIGSTGIAALADACRFNGAITRVNLQMETTAKIVEERVVTGLTSFNHKIYDDFIHNVFALGMSALQNMSLWQLRGFYSNIELALSRATDHFSLESTKLSTVLENIQNYFRSVTNIVYPSWLPIFLPGMPTGIYNIIAGYMIQTHPFMVSVTILSCNNISTGVMLKNGAEVPNFSVHQPLVQVQRFTRLCYENDEKVPERFH